MKLKDITNYLEVYAPLKLQEAYDNSGLLIGSVDQEINKAMITLDVTDDVLQEAITKRCEFIIAHHPLIFKGLKSLTGKNYVEKLVVKAIKNNIAIYAIHTNLDNVRNGVNGILAEKLGLINTRILEAKRGSLKKLVTFCPVQQTDTVRDAMFNAGAGHIGEYDSCSFNLEGEGTFKALKGAEPFVGQKGELHFEKETRIETIVPEFRLNDVINAMLAAHPYEEVAYDIYPLGNANLTTGAGMIGELPKEMDAKEFLLSLKETLNSKVIKYNSSIDRKIKKVAICGGSGSFLIDSAFRSGSDLFITGDVKYHDFFEHQEKMIIADAGHYETEQFTKELLYAILKEKFPNFALLISSTVTNPVNVL